jgi:outer membrane protein OmpA-like peptidoglycan-associated protein
MSQFVFGRGLHRVRLVRSSAKLRPYVRDGDGMLAALRELEMSDDAVVAVAEAWGFVGRGVQSAAGHILERYLSGDLEFLREEDEWPRLGRFTPGLGDHDDPHQPIIPMREPTFIGVTVVHESGATYPGAVFNVLLPDGELRTVRLDHASSFRIDDIRDSGSCRLRPFRHRYELTDSQRAAARTPVVTRGDDVRARVGDDASLALRTGAEHRVIVRATEATWYEVRLVDELGGAIAGVTLRLSVRGRTHSLTTDAEGVARFEDMPISDASVDFADGDQLRAEVRKRWETERQGEWVAESDNHSYIECTDPLGGIGGVVIAGERRHTIVVQPRVICARLLELVFDTNKTFLLPSAIEHLAEVRSLYEARPEGAVLIVGHTDATGDAATNDPLSLARAESVRAFLKDDVDAWLAQYGADVEESARWGEDEDDHMLRAVMDRRAAADGSASVAGFQESEGLAATATMDAATRRALVAAYMAADGTSLPEELEPLVHGCGENFPVSIEGAADTDALNRRVELFFFEPTLDVLPPPPGDVSETGSWQYPQWRRHSVATHDYFVRSDVETVRILMAVTDEDAPYPSERPEAYRLESQDGSYSAIRTMSDATRISKHHYALEFRHVPRGLLYLLVDGRPSLIREVSNVNAS